MIGAADWRLVVGATGVPIICASLQGRWPGHPNDDFATLNWPTCARLNWPTFTQ